jgi:molybdopterin molybdotransferase
MLSVAEALQLVLSRAKPKPPVDCPVDAALAAVLAEDIASDVDSPPHDKSLVDGYAVRAADLAAGLAELEILEEVTAGAVPTQTVRRGTTTRVMTGAPIPHGADAVVMIEHSHVVESTSLGRVQIRAKQTAAGQNIMRRAASMARGQMALRAGCELRAVEMGVLAEVGRTHVSVVGRPTLSVLPTGNELVPSDQAPGAGQIRNSNGPLLVAAAQTAGAVAASLGIARDDHEQLRQLIGRGLKSDVLVISGGVSAGVLDLVPEVLAELGIEQVFHKVNLKPGKPLWFGVLPGGGLENASGASGDKLVFGLPGNPVSSLVCFELFVRPAVGVLAGRGDTSLGEVAAELAIAHVHRGDRPTFHPARLVSAEGRMLIEPLRWQGSGDLRTLVEANALACFPAGDREYRAGETIRALRLPRPW